MNIGWKYLILIGMVAILVNAAVGMLNRVAVPGRAGYRSPGA
jgi:hypothetical protein